MLTQWNYLEFCFQSMIIKKKQFAVCRNYVSLTTGVVRTVIKFLNINNIFIISPRDRVFCLASISIQLESKFQWKFCWSKLIYPAAIYYKNKVSSYKDWHYSEKGLFSHIWFTFINPKSPQWLVYMYIYNNKNDQNTGLSKTTFYVVPFPCFKYFFLSVYWNQIIPLKFSPILPLLRFISKYLPLKCTFSSTFD